MNKTLKRSLSVITISLGISASMYAAERYGALYADSHREYRYALELLDRGMFNRSEKIFSDLVRSGEKSDAEAYSVYCEVKMRAKGYQPRMLKYLEKHPYSVLAPAIRYQYAMNMFDEQEYAIAAAQFDRISPKYIPKRKRAEFIFYKSYSQLESRNEKEAVAGFMQIDKMPESDFSAPARYTLGYLNYEQRNFAKAVEWFEASAEDSRFAEMSRYYLVECRFLMEEYDYVIAKGPEVFEHATDSRKTQLARFISESYLVNDQPERARYYFDYINDRGGDKNRNDWFYSGSLLYQLEDFKGAVECFSKMEDRGADSLGQAADYHLGYSYIRLRNKVAALQAFREASKLDYNLAMKEDAYYNYAKLAFDLNSDTSVFYDYLKKYTSKEKGERIYSYIAVAALYSKDYQAAIDAYDMIDDLDEDMKSNYVKANYLRASQLYQKGAYRSAVPCLKAVAFYTERNSPLYLRTRYWLAESSYRSGDYSGAISIYNDLYNLSAFYGRPEYDNILYGLGYCYFRQEKYEQSERWFDEYLGRSGKGASLEYRKDALVRKGDCQYITADYKGAAQTYDTVVTDYFNVDDIYPYYQAAIAYGLSGDSSRKITLLENVTGAKAASNFYPDAMYELGRSYVSAREDKKAFDCFKALAEKSENVNFKAKACLEMGMLARNEGKVDEAIGIYKSVVENYADTDFANDALLAIESVYKSIHQPEVYLEYIASIGKSEIKTDEEKEQMIFNAAEHIFAGGNYEKALVSLQNYIDKYPSGKELHRAQYYIAESYRNLSQLESACDYYRKAVKNGEGSVKELSLLNLAEISYRLDKFDEAYSSYSALVQIASLSNNKEVGKTGMMRSAFRMHAYDKTIAAAEQILQTADKASDLAREADYCLAKSYISTSQREKAMEKLHSLAARPVDEFGAEASFLLIQDLYDQGEFAKVEESVYAMTDSGTKQMYWLAKAFIVMGDSFVERGQLNQAKATFESIRNEYSPVSDQDDVLENVDMRLAKLNSMINAE